MKIRTGFVSNSSSSSYVCEICNTATEAYDCNIYEIGFCECENGHMFCIDHILFRTNEPNEDRLIPSIACPICQFKKMPDHLFITYIKKRTGISKEDVLKDMKERFKDWKELIEYLNSK